MNTFLSRANTIFAFTLSVLSSLTFGCFLSTFFNANMADVAISTGKILVKNVPDYSTSRQKQDLGFITFDINSDLGNVFNWNVKELFLYLTAEYETKDNKLNQVVLWDKIIQRGEKATLNYKNMNAKYYFWDDGHGLRGNKNVTLYLSWNIIPNAGGLPFVIADRKHSFAFPNEYAASKI